MEILHSLDVERSAELDKVIKKLEDDNRHVLRVKFKL